MGSAKSVRVKELETVFAGRRNSMGGSFARTGLPLAVGQTAYNANNQLTQWGTANLFYDLNGNMTSSGSDGYTWDARNRLVSTLSGASFQYDAFRRRTTKMIGGTTTSFLYDGANAVQEVIGGTNTANSLSGGVDEVFQRTDSAGARSFLGDALGSTLALADSTGALQTQYTFEPFGNTTQSGSSTTNSFAYTGRELDAGNLYFYRARYYGPDVGRFISEDPVRFHSDGTNLYPYVGNNPVREIDPSGLSHRCWGLCGGKCCNFSSNDEWWLDDGVWKRLPPGKIVASSPQDGGLQTVKAQTLNLRVHPIRAILDLIGADLSETRRLQVTLGGISEY